MSELKLHYAKRSVTVVVATKRIVNLVWSWLITILKSVFLAPWWLLSCLPALPKLLVGWLAYISQFLWHIISSLPRKIRGWIGRLAGIPLLQSKKQQIISNIKLWQARLRVRWQRRQPPAAAIMAPTAPLPSGILPARKRLIRISAMLIGINVTLVGMALSYDDVPASTPTPFPVVSAQLAALPSVTATPQPTNTPTQTPLPSLTALPSSTPLPTLDPLPWPAPDPLATSGSIIFTMVIQGNRDIYALSIGQQEPTRLTSHPSADRQPSFSPDGSQAAFASRRSGNWDIYLLNLKNGELRQLTSQPGYDANPAWSPDGEWILYESWQENNLDIYMMHTSGTRWKRLTTNAALDFAPAWSPDGRYAAFTSWRAGNQDIFTYDVQEQSETPLRNLTNSPDRHEYHPAFRPDGLALTFYENQSGFDLIHELTLASDNESNETRVLGQGRQPVWSPDGEALVYVHSLPGGDLLIAGNGSAWSASGAQIARYPEISEPDVSTVSLPVNLSQRLPHVSLHYEAITVEEAAEPSAEGAPYLLQTVAGNTPFPYLNDRVDGSFTALRYRIRSEAGWDMLAEMEAMFEPITASGAPGQNKQTWHKAGRAFDFDNELALSLNPQIEVVREDRGGDTFWRIYVRAVQQDGSMGEPLRQLPWDFRARFGQDAQYYDEGGKLKETIPVGYYVDFTALAAEYGWQRVPASSDWRFFYPGIKFWHFENQQGLTWEEAMLELYTAAELDAEFSR